MSSVLFLSLSLSVLHNLPFSVFFLFYFSTQFVWSEKSDANKSAFLLSDVVHMRYFLFHTDCPLTYTNLVLGMQYMHKLGDSLRVGEERWEESKCDQSSFVFFFFYVSLQKSVPFPTLTNQVNN